MLDGGQGTADALDATIDTDDVGNANAIAEAEQVVAGAQARVDRQRQHLAYAEQTLATVQAALAALEGA